MQIILSTGCLYEYLLSDVFWIARSSGFDGIELLINRRNSSVETHHIQGLSVDYNMPILSLHSPFMVCDGWGGFWDSVHKSLDMALELSIPLVNFHPPTGFILRHHLNSELSEYIWIYRDILEGSGIVLTIENLPTLRFFRKLFIDRFFPHLVNNAYDIAKFARENGVYVTFDTTHIGTMSVDLLDAYDVFKDRIANIHLSDYDGRSQHLLPGKGHLPLEKLLMQVKRDRFEGIITLETNPAAMESADKAKAARNAKQSLLYIRNALRDSSLTTETQRHGGK